MIALASTSIGERFVHWFIVGLLVLGALRVITGGAAERPRG